MSQPPRVCPYCKKPFTPKRKEQQFCSLRCGYNGHRIHPAPTQALPQEEWRPCPQYEDIYQISNYGRVRRESNPGHLLTVDPNAAGYPRVWLSRAGVKQRLFVHHLVATAFVGPRPAGYEINHKDVNPANPSADNLEYVTPSENSHHARRNGHWGGVRGEAQSMAKLNDAAVREIRRSGDSVRELATRFGVTPQIVGRARSGKTWKHVG